MEKEESVVADELTDAGLDGGYTANSGAPEQNPRSPTRRLFTHWRENPVDLMKASVNHLFSTSLSFSLRQ